MNSSSHHGILTLHQIMRDVSDDDLACADAEGLLHIANCLEALALEINATARRLRNRCCVH